MFEWPLRASSNKGIILQMAYIQQASRAWDVAWEILHDDRDWTVKKGRDLKTGLVMSKSYKNLGLVHKLEVV